MKSGVKASVFNAPEILTNSSSIFLGVEVALYPLLGAFRKEAPDHPYTKQLFADCNRLLKDGHTADEVLQIADKYFQSDIIQNKWSDYAGWPQHNGPEQMARMQEASKTILEMHKSDRELLTATLSEVVFKACGRAMITEGANPSGPVSWIGHDLVAKLSLNN